MNETPAQLRQLLSRLIADWENEVIEFKPAEKGKFTEVVGKYVSALSNEANLRRMDCAWLVYGVDNKTRKVVGHTYMCMDTTCVPMEFSNGVVVVQ